MKKTSVTILMLLFLANVGDAADTKTTALSELTAVIGADVLYIVDDIAGTATSMKITVLNLFDVIDTFAELNTIVADKTLVNEEDAVTWDALGTFALGITITTGDPFTLGTNRIDNGSDLLDGEMIAADTIDDDSLDFADITGVDLTLTDCGAITSTGTITAAVGFDITGAVDIDYGSADVTDHTFLSDGTGTGEFVLKAGAIDGTEILDDTIDSADYAAGSIDAEHLAADIVDETKIADDGIDSEHYNDGSIDLVHLAAGVYAKDLVTTSPITGAADNIFVGADSDVTIAITLAKDLVTTAPVTGGTDNILPGADADITVALDFTAAWDFGGGDLELPQASPGVPGVDGGIELDFTDGTVVIQHGSAHAELGSATDVVVAKLIRCFGGTIFEPDGVNDVITVKAINSIEFPHGVVITAVYLGIASNTTYTLTVQNFDDFDTINATNGTIDAVTYTADTTGEVIDTSPTYATIAAGQIIMISIPATDVDWIHFEIYFYEPAA